MVKRVMGMVVSESKPDRMFREQKLGTGRGPTSDVQRFNYTADPRDSRVYWAERGLRLAFEQDPRWQGREPWFIDTEHAQVWVDLVMSTAPSARNAPAVRVLPTRLSSAHYRGAIYLPIDPRWMRGLIVLHEIAHHLSYAPGSFHGQRFIDVFGDLLATMFEPPARDLFLGFLNGEQ